MKTLLTILRNKHIEKKGDKKTSLCSDIVQRRKGYYYLLTTFLNVSKVISHCYPIRCIYPLSTQGYSDCWTKIRFYHTVCERSRCILSMKNSDTIFLCDTTELLYVTRSWNEISMNRYLEQNKNIYLRTITKIRSRGPRANLKLRNWPNVRRNRLELSAIICTENGIFSRKHSL